MNFDIFNDDSPGQSRIADWSFLIQSDVQNVDNV